MRIQVLEHIIEQRFESFLEPRLEHWFRRYLESSSGEAIISTILADVIVSWMRPGTGEDNYLETIVLDLVGRLKDNPGFRERILATMSNKTAD